MGALVDSSAFVAVEKAEPGRDWLKRALTNDGGLFVNPVIVAELALGSPWRRRFAGAGASKNARLGVACGRARHRARHSKTLRRNQRDTVANEKISVAEQ